MSKKYEQLEAEPLGKVLTKLPSVPPWGKKSAAPSRGATPRLSTTPGSLLGVKKVVWPPLKPSLRYISAVKRERTAPPLLSYT